MPDPTRNPPDEKPTADFPVGTDHPAGSTTRPEAAVAHRRVAADRRAVALEFDRLWDTTAPPDIRRFLPADDPERLAVLAELVLIHAARRRSAGLPVRATDYLDEFPELFADVNTVAELNRLATGLAPPGYELFGEIGRGGMGVVYRARETSLDRDVAVKLLREEYAPGSFAARRFLEEARITAQLQHPGVPPVHAVGMLPDGRPFLAMKLIKGQTLAQDLDARPDPAGEPGRFLATFELLCQAVGYAHAHNVIHRDIKPSNVMVGAFGEVQVMDWGLAKVLSAGGGDPAPPPPEQSAPLTEIRTPRTEDDEATRAGEVMGTFAYMPPEQAVGQVGRVDRRSDVFALGSVLCTVLTGHPPYTGGHTETRAKAELGLTDEAFRRLDACGVDPELVALAKRCLARNPAERPADASEVAGLVAEHRAGVETRLHAVERERAASAVQATEQRRRRRLLAAAGGVVVAALAVAAGVSAWQARLARDAEIGAKADAEAARKAEDAARDSETAAVTARNAEKQERETADEVIRFMAQVLAYGASAGQGKDPKREPTVKDALDRAAREIEGKFKGRPRVEVKVRRAVAEAYHSLRDLPATARQLERVLEILRADPDPDHETTWAMMNNLGDVYQNLATARLGEPRKPSADDQERFAEARKRFADAEKLFADAENLLTAALVGKRGKLGNDNRSTLTSAHNLGALYREMAVREYRVFAAAPSAHNLGRVARVLDLFDKAERLHWEAYHGRRRLFGEKDDHSLRSTNNIGVLRVKQGRAAEAEPYFREAAAGFDEIGSLAPAAACWKNLGDSLLVQKKYAEAVPAYDKALAIFDRITPSEGARLRPQIDRALEKMRAEDGRIAPPPREVKRP